MPYRTSRLSLGTAGPVTFPTPFQPDGCELYVGPKAQADTHNHLSIGSGCYDTNGTTLLQNCISTGSFGTSHMTQDFNDRIISQWEYVSGVWTEVLRANFLGFSSAGILLDVIIPNVQYRVVARRRI